MENITFTYTFTDVMMKIKQLISNIREDEESNKPFALMGYKWVDISIV